ncbi:transposon Ty3-I Gag-Pol polyprotein [Trichonephila clavipes]|nr:transposon Ty3-I Gag-Pol polyprotein [Trichonephila clavipes]
MDISEINVPQQTGSGFIVWTAPETQPCSSPYASQVVIVKKRDGKSRVCIDYRRLNRKLIKDNYPLPLIDDILDCLQNAKIFTTLDLKNGFLKSRIIPDKGSTFEDCCNKQNILHIFVTTCLPRSNGQIEKQNSTIIAVLSTLSVDDPKKWYSHAPHLQEILNSNFQRSIKMTPFELLFGTKMKSCQAIKVVQLLNDEITAQFQEQRDALRQDAKKQIYKVQEENRRTYNLRRIQAHKYQLHDLVAIKRTQFGPGLKLKQKYLGPYKVTKVKHNDTYDVEKCDFVYLCRVHETLAKPN